MSATTWPPSATTSASKPSSRLSVSVACMLCFFPRATDLSSGQCSLCNLGSTDLKTGQWHACQKLLKEIHSTPARNTAKRQVSWGFFWVPFGTPIDPQRTRWRLHRDSQYFLKLVPTKPYRNVIAFCLMNQRAPRASEGATSKTPLPPSSRKGLVKIRAVEQNLVAKPGQDHL